MKKDLPQRKHIRLRNYDYSLNGGYFITICTQNKRCVLSSIVGRGLIPTAEERAVGRGLAPAEQECIIEYTECGKIAEEQLQLLEKRYGGLTIDRYVIMPNHIHAIFIISDAAGASPRPTIMDIVCAYKSLTSRACKGKYAGNKLFQTSFYEHVIRGEEDYLHIAKYIDENPLGWYYDELYTEN